MPGQRPFRIVALVSGRGSNLEAIIRAIRNNRLQNVEIAMVISDNPDAKALSLCKAYNVPARYLYPGPFKTKMGPEAEKEYVQIIKKVNPDLIVLAGFMRIIKEGFINSFPHRIINIHPSLLPKYPGLHTHSRALEAQDTEAGCTVHFVSAVTDGGKRIMQATVPILPGDTEETLAERVLEQEHRLLPKVIELFSEGKIDYERLPEEPVMLERIIK